MLAQPNRDLEEPLSVTLEPLKSRFQNLADYP